MYLFVRTSKLNFPIPYVNILLIIFIHMDFLSFFVQIYGKFVYNYRTDECDFSDQTEHGLAPRKLFLSLGFLLPCIVIIVSYSYIFYKVSKRKIYVLRLYNTVVNCDRVCLTWAETDTTDVSPTLKGRGRG